MPPGSQMHLGERPPAQGARKPFLTDEGIARRLAQLKNGLAHLEAMIPAMQREVELLAAQFPKAAGDED